MDTSDWDWTLIWTAGAALGNFALATFGLLSLRASRVALSAGETQLTLARRQTEVAEDAAIRAREEARKNDAPQIFILSRKTETNDYVSLLNAGGGYIILSEIRLYVSTGSVDGDTSHEPFLTGEDLEALINNYQFEVVIGPETDHKLIDLKPAARQGSGRVYFIRLSADLRYSREPAESYRLEVLVHTASGTLPANSLNHLKRITPQ